MDRRLFITVHMYLSSFFAVAVLLVAVSGGLYLLGQKGQVEKTVVASLPKAEFSLPESASKADVEALLSAAGIEGFDFEYVRQSGSRAFTRPTSRLHYIVDASGEAIEITRGEPSFQARMMELHKGHGPTAFKTFQKVFALGMVFIIVSGLLLGLSAARLRRSTLITAGAGALVFAVLLL
jgi:hypothetical protein